MTTAILDASALLAMLLGEPGDASVRAALTESAMSTLNFAEVIGHFARHNASESDIHKVLDPLPITRIPFDETLAYGTGLMFPMTRSAGLSLGDRTCLALGKSMGLKVLTADRSWHSFRDLLGIDIELIRP